MKPIQIVGGALLFLCLLALGFGFGSVMETNTAGWLQVKQAAVTGDLTCQLQPGMYFQNFGEIHTYKEAETFYFSADADKDGKSDDPLTTRFYDGTMSTVTGSLRVLMPQDCVQLTKLHRTFHSMDGVMTKLVLPAVRKALFSTGPHMTASESYAERRGEFAVLAEDQLRNGVILTDQAEKDAPDPITGEIKRLTVVVKETCKPTSAANCIGGYTRDPSAFHEFGISVTNFVIDQIDYPQTVLDQIETQRKARMNILTQQAQAKEAEARASKADAEAKAQVAETRAKEEVEKTTKVVRAETAKVEAVLNAQRIKEVAQLDVQSAELEKRAEILRAEGAAESASKRIKADGALDKKLSALMEINKVWAEAYTQQRPTPDMVVGGGATTTAEHNPAANFMSLLTAKTARDLQIDLAVAK